jgi:hypothetical protein
LADLARFGISFDIPEVSQESDRQKEGVEIEEKEEEKPPPPSIKVSNIDPLGLVTISFNQEFLVPDEWWNIDFSHVLSFGLRSTSDGSLVMGNFVKPPK